MAWRRRGGRGPSRPTPIPSTNLPQSVATPPAPSPARRWQAEVSQEYQKVLKEVHPSQRAVLKGVEPRAVTNIGAVKGRALSGETLYPTGGRVQKLIMHGLSTVGAIPKFGMRISKEGRDPTIAKVRHETAHVILFKSGVAPEMQHPIMDLTRRGAEKQLRLSTLPYAMQAKTHPEARKRREALTLLWKQRERNR